MRADWIIPLSLMAFTAVPVAVLSPIFNTSTRWPIVLIAFLYVVLNRRRVVAESSAHAMVAVAVFSVWLIASSLWSLNPELSFFKAIAGVLVVTALVSGGYRLMLNGQGVLLFGGVTLVGCIAGLTGLGLSTAYDSGLYRGGTGGPNSMGSLAAMGLVAPLLFLFTRRDGTKPQRLVWAAIGVAILLFYFLMEARARASILWVAVIAAFLLFASGRARAACFVAVSVATGLVAPMIFPNEVHTLTTKYIYKSSTRDQGVLNSRTYIWAESWELAKQGGVVGLGMGVTANDDATDISSGSLVTSVGYGREKGSSVLALIEEVGFIGLSLMLICIVSVLSCAKSAFKTARDSQNRASIAILAGAFFGAVLHGGFEAWMLSPGSPEAPMFWAIYGGVLGACDRSLLANRAEYNTRRKN